MCCFSLVQLFWTSWFGEVHKVDWEEWHVCDLKAWTVYPSWMDSWVNNALLLFLFSFCRSQLLPFNILYDLFIVIRGLPYWLREVPGIFFRTDNKPFKVLYGTYKYMSKSKCMCFVTIKYIKRYDQKILLQEHTERYVRMILDKMKEERLFASQGGPIILGQVTK